MDIPITPDARLAQVEAELQAMREASHRHTTEFYWKTIIGPLIIAVVPVIAQLLKR